MLAASRSTGDRRDRRSTRAERIAEALGGSAPDILVNNAGTSFAQLARRADRRGLAGAVGAARHGLDAAHARVRARRWPSAAGAGSSTSTSSRRQAALAHQRRLLRDQGRPALALARVRRHLGRPGRARQRGRARARWRRRCGWTRAGSPTRPPTAQGISREEAIEAQAAKIPLGRFAHRGGDRERRRLPLLRARLDVTGAALVGRRRRGCNHRLKSETIAPMPPAARVGDMHTCPMVTPARRRSRTSAARSCRPGAPTVLIGGMPAAAVGDMCTCVGPPDSIVMGSTKVHDQGQARRPHGRPDGARRHDRRSGARRS